MFCAPHTQSQNARLECRNDGLHLAMKALDDKRSWTDFVPGYVARAYNSLQSSVTKIAPDDVERGYRPLGIMDYNLRPEITQTPVELKKAKFNKALLKHIDDLKKAKAIYVKVTELASKQSRDREHGKSQQET